MITIEAKQLEQAFDKLADGIKPAIWETVLFLHQKMSRLAVRRCPESFGFLTPKSNTKIVAKINGGYLVSGNMENKRPGRLKQSMKLGSSENVSELNERSLTATFGTNVPYAPSIVENTNAYLIRPKGKFLFFAVTPRLAVLKKQVKHPGGKAVTGKGGDAMFPRIAKEIAEEAPKALFDIMNKRGLI